MELYSLSIGAEKMSQTFNELLLYAIENGASDIHLSVGSKPIMRLDGSLKRFGESELVAGDTKTMAYQILTEEQIKQFEQNGEIDLAYTIPGSSRFRLNIYYQIGYITIAARVIPFEIPSIDQLGLPAVLTRIARNDKGIVLVTGPTGSGKSSTLATMIDYINKNFDKHIITLEDPIEFIHENKRCLIEQRQVGIDTKSFDNGLRAALVI